MRLEDIVLIIEENPTDEDHSKGMWHWSVITLDNFIKKFGKEDLSKVIQGLYATREHTTDYYSDNLGTEEIEGFAKCFVHDSKRYRCRFFTDIHFVKDFLKRTPLDYEYQKFDNTGDYDTADECRNFLLLSGIDLDAFMLEADHERAEESYYRRNIRNILLVNVLKDNQEYHCIMTEDDFIDRYIKENHNADSGTLNRALVKLYQTKDDIDVFSELSCRYIYADGRDETFLVSARFCANRSQLIDFIRGFLIYDVECEYLGLILDECTEELKPIYLAAYNDKIEEDTR